MNNTAAQTDMITCRLMTNEESDALYDPRSPIRMPFLGFEACVYHSFGKLCPDYSGGCWGFYVLSTGAWFMAPTDEPRYTLLDAMNGRHEMSAESAGLANMIYLLNHRVWKLHECGDRPRYQAALEHYEALMAYAWQREDAAAIRWVLD